METSHTLQLYYDNEFAGVLIYQLTEDQYTFEFSGDWLKKAKNFPFSPALSLKNANSNSAVIKRFLENLLPEGKARETASNFYQVLTDNLYALLSHIGKETTGAISLIPQKAESSAVLKREITYLELCERVQKRKDDPFSIWDQSITTSIAGYQDKLPIYIEEQRFYLPNNSLLSTHILKPEPANTSPKSLVANEYFCMRLAAAVKLPTAHVSIVRTPLPLLVVERFDRIRKENAVQRLHVIDSCQALDLPVTHKYERNYGSGTDVAHIREGVSFEKLFTLSNISVNKALMQWHLLRLAIFQYLIGNIDGHGKNVSFFCYADGLALAPFYDLVSIFPYTASDYEPAMAIGDEFSSRALSSNAWLQFARRCGIDRRLLVNEMKELVKNILKEAPRLANDPVYNDEERAIVEKIVSAIQQQGKQLTAITAGIQMQMKDKAISSAILHM